VLRVNPKTMRREASVQLDAFPDGVNVGFGYGYVWAHQYNHGTGKLYRIDPKSNRVTSTTSVGDPALGNSRGTGGDNLGFGKDSIWTCDTSGTLTQTDAVTGQVKAVTKLPMERCSWLSVGAGSVWVSSIPRDAQTIRIQLP
jgi:hypothetical protein